MEVHTDDTRMDEAKEEDSAQQANKRGGEPVEVCDAMTIEAFRARLSHRWPSDPQDDQPHGHAVGGNRSVQGRKHGRRQH